MKELEKRRRPEEPEFGDEDGLSLEERLRMIAYFTSLAGRYRVFSELRGYWMTRLYLNLPCNGASVRDREVAVLEEDILSHPWDRLQLAIEFLCTGRCRRESDLQTRLGGEVVPWSPVGKSSPWE